MVSVSGIECDSSMPLRRPGAVTVYERTKRSLTLSVIMSKGEHEQDLRRFWSSPGYGRVCEIRHCVAKVKRTSLSVWLSPGQSQTIIVNMIRKAERAGMRYSNASMDNKT
jgi:hypothetical protein